MKTRSKITTAVFAGMLATAAATNVAAACTPPPDNLAGCAYLNGGLPSYLPDPKARRALEAGVAQAAAWRVAQASWDTDKWNAADVAPMSDATSWWPMYKWLDGPQVLPVLYQGILEVDEIIAYPIIERYPTIGIGWNPIIEPYGVVKVRNVYPIFNIELSVVAPFEKAYSALLAIEDRLETVSANTGIPIELHFNRGEMVLPNGSTAIHAMLNTNGLSTLHDDVDLRLTISTENPDDNLGGAYWRQAPSPSVASFGSETNRMANINFKLLEGLEGLALSGWEDACIEYLAAINPEFCETLALSGSEVGCIEYIEATNPKFCEMGGFGFGGTVLSSETRSVAVPALTRDDAIPDDLERLLLFVEELRSFSDVVAFDFRGWTVRSERSFLTSIDSLMPSSETYRLESSAKIGSAEVPVSSDDTTDTRPSTIVPDPPSPMLIGITDSDGTITSNRGAVNDAIGFLHLAAAIRRFSFADLTIIRVNRPQIMQTQESSGRIHSMITWSKPTCYVESSLNVRAAGRLDEGGTAQSIVDRIGDVMRAFGERGLRFPEIQAVSIRGSTWVAALSSEGCPISDELDVTSDLISALRRLGVDVDGSQYTDGFEIAFKVPPPTDRK